MAKKTQKEEIFSTIKVKGEDLLKEINKIIYEGNVRKIVIKDETGKRTYVEIPLTFGVIGTLLAPVLAAIGALAAMVGLVTVEIVSDEKKAGAAKKTATAKKADEKTAKKSVKSKK